MSFLVSVFVAGVLLQADVLGAEQCVTAHYKELGCDPGPGQENATCPTFFSCPPFYPDNSNCYYRGASYSIKTKIPANIVTNPCSIDCFCSQSPFDVRPAFSCAAVIDCPEFFSEDRDEACVKQYSFTSCCSESEVCGNDEISKLSTCEWEGHTYREGERFYPNNTCKSCVCGPGFNGNLDTFCRDVSCGIEIHNQLSLAAKCAPVFTETSQCCPIYWKCPEDGSIIVRNNDSKSVSDPNMMCMFGNSTLRVGEEVVTASDNCTTCSCRTPPLITCILDTGCQDTRPVTIITTQATTL